MSAPAPDFSPLPAAAPSFAGYADQQGLNGAGFWPRAAARVIDTLVHQAIVFFVALSFVIMLAVAAMVAGAATDSALAVIRERSAIADIVLGIAGSIAYHTVCESFHGSTLGKLVLGLVVVQEDGTPCRFRSALVRSLGYFCDALSSGWWDTLRCKKQTSNNGTATFGHVPWL